MTAPADDKTATTMTDTAAEPAAAAADPNAPLKKVVDALLITAICVGLTGFVLAIAAFGVLQKEAEQQAIVADCRMDAALAEKAHGVDCDYRIKADDGKRKEALFRAAAAIEAQQARLLLAARRNQG